MFFFCTPENLVPTRQELIKTANLLFAQLDTSYMGNSLARPAAYWLLLERQWM